MTQRVRTLLVIRPTVLTLWVIFLLNFCHTNGLVSSFKKWLRRCISSFSQDEIKELVQKMSTKMTTKILDLKKLSFWLSRHLKELLSRIRIAIEGGGGKSLLWIEKVRVKDKTYIWVSVWWKTKNQSWEIYTSRIHWVARGTGTPKECVYYESRKRELKRR